MLLIFVALLYGFVSVPLMIFFVLLLGINSQFSHSFYRIVQCDMVLNVATFLSTWVSRLTQEETSKPFMIHLFYNYHFIYHIAAICTPFFFHAQSVSTITLCLHRFSSAKFRSSNIFWLKFYPLVYFIILSYSATLVVPLYTLRYFSPLTYHEDTKIFDYEEVGMEKLEAYWSIFGFISKVYFLLITITGIVTLLFLRKQFSQIEYNSQTRAMMRKMTLIALINTIIYLTVILWQIFLSYFFEDLNTEIMNALMMIVSDVLSLSMPYILILCDTNVRRVFRSIVFSPEVQPSSILGNRSASS